jgi:hypothetical protein
VHETLPPRVKNPNDFVHEVEQFLTLHVLDDVDEKHDVNASGSLSTQIGLYVIADDVLHSQSVGELNLFSGHIDALHVFVPEFGEVIDEISVPTPEVDDA